MNELTRKAISTIAVVIIVVIIVIAAGVGVYLATTTSKTTTTSSSTSSTSTSTSSIAPTSCTSPSTFCFPAKPKGSNATLSGTVTIGVITDLTSSLSAIGIPIGYATQLAAQNINTWLAGTQWAGKITFKADVVDYALKSSQALTDLSTFATDGVSVVIGPLDSGTVGALYSTAASDNIVLISPSSTSVLLAGVSNYLYRTVPNDAFQAQADSQEMYQDGVRNLIIVYTNQAYGSGLANATAALFAAKGGNVTAKIPYTPSTTSFGPTLQSMDSAWTTAVANAGGNSSSVAFQVIGYQEVGTLLQQASSSYPALLNTTQPWYGTDGEADNNAFTNTTFATYSEMVRLPSTFYETTNTSASANICSAINANTSGGCDPYTLGAYDDTWLAADSIMQCGVSSGLGTCLSSGAVAQVANESVGVTGPMTLGSDHDRIGQAYLIYDVQTISGAATWVIAGNWTVTTDTVTWNQYEPKF